MNNQINSKVLDRVSIVGLIILSFLFNFGLSMYGGILSPDGMQYASLGKNIIDLRAYTSNGSHFPDIVQPPLYPLLISFLYSLLRDSYVSGFAVASLFGALAIAPLFSIAYRTFGRTTAILSVLLLAVHPLFFNTTLNIGSDSLYYFLFLCVVAVSLKLTQTPKLSLSMLIGLLIGLAYATRIEGVTLFFFFAALLWTNCANQNIRLFKTKAASLAILGFLVVYIPLTCFIYQQSGRLMFCPKCKLILVHRQIWHASEFNPSFNTASYTIKSLQTYFKYDPETNGLLANRLFNEQNNRRSVDNAGLNRYNRKHPEILRIMVGFLKTFISNSFSLYRQFTYITMFPPLLFPLAIIGFLGVPWSRQRWKSNYCLSAAIFVSLAFLFANVQVRFLCPAVSLSLLWCAEGIVICTKTITESIANTGLFKPPKFVLHVVTGILILSISPSVFGIVKYNRTANEYYFAIAQFIKNHVPKEAVVISANPQAPYLAQRNYAPLPYLTFDELKVYATQFKESAVVLSNEDEMINPDLMRALHRDGDRKSGEKYKKILGNGYTILLFSTPTS